MPRNRRHYRVTLADALSAHERALASGGGVAGVPNPGLVESAIGRPYTGYYRTIERKTAALVHSVARNHGFADGNKRTALILAYALVTRSGYALVAADEHESLEHAAEAMVLDVVNGRMSFDELVDWLRKRTRPLRPRRR